MYIKNFILLKYLIYYNTIMIKVSFNFFKGLILEVKIKKLI